MKRLSFALIAACLASSPTWAWGPVGHRIVAETAALLVQDDLPSTWGPLLARHRFELGVYAFLPDALFRHIDGAGGSTEAPTHYLNLDAVAGGAARVGSVDRRIAQFVELARVQLEGVNKPAGGYERGAVASGDARSVYLALYDLGVLSHYSGDVAMPYHATADWNGYSLGEGGVHFYFESDCVNALEPGLARDVLRTARRHRKTWLRSWGEGRAEVADLVRVVLRDSLAAVATVSALDRAHAVTKLQPPGSSLPATRKPASKGCGALRKILVDRLARGAILTATLWESVLPRGVDFGQASELQFSDMILAPDYPEPR